MFCVFIHPYSRACVRVCVYTGDLHLALVAIKEVLPHSRVFCVGVSMGAHVLTKYLIEEGRHARGYLSAGVACCSVWDVGTVNKDTSFIKKMYGMMLMYVLRRSILQNTPGPETLSEEDFHKFKSMREVLTKRKLWTLADFDEHLTIKMLGYDTAEDFYRDSGTHT